MAGRRSAALLLLCLTIIAPMASFASQQNRRLMAPGNTFTPEGGKGAWSSIVPTGNVFIHAVLMKNNEVVGWAPYVKGQSTSAVLNYNTKKYTELLKATGGIHGTRNAFCGGMTSSADQHIFIFGGHSGDVQWFRRYNHNDRSMEKPKQMSSPRWYLGAATMPDAKVVVIGGVKKSGAAGYGATDRTQDNPTYEMYNPVTGAFGGTKQDMKEQLSAAWPLHSYPHAVVTPDGGLAVSSGKSLYKYTYNAGAGTFKKQFAYPPRPGAPWSYPQTGQAVPLPMEPPYDKQFFLSAGGSDADRANDKTPASKAAHVIELTGGQGANWVDVGPMPYARVMGDGVHLCDGTILFGGGARIGTAGWGGVQKAPGLKMTFNDNSVWYCPTKCGKAPVSAMNYEPVIYDPKTQKWSAAGSLNEAKRPRGYHSSTLLTADCTVMFAGSDVTNGNNAEFFSPPHLFKGTRPVITGAPGTAKANGGTISVGYTSEDPIVDAMLIRTGASTHSVPYDSRALRLAVAVAPGTATVTLPPNSKVCPPGMYMLTLLTSKGVPSKAKIISFTN